MLFQRTRIGRYALIVSLGIGTSSLSASAALASPVVHTRTHSTDTSVITKNWESFFSGHTPAKLKIALLQNGWHFKQIIDAQSSSALARSAGAKVLSVSAITRSSAKVKYNVLVGGTTALSNQLGQAVRVNGKWLVGMQSFCGLLHLEGTKAAACRAKS